jgi:hypothetical protein
MSVNSPSFRLTALRITSAGVIGDFDVEDVSSVRTAVENAGAGNTIIFRGKLKGQTNFITIQTVTGSFCEVVELDTYDILQIECTVYDSLSTHISISSAGYTPELRIIDVIDQVINDNVTAINSTWSSDKISTILTEFGDKNVRTSRFELISSGTSGSITVAAGQTIILDDFGGTVDAVVTTVSGGRPTNYPSQDVSGQIIATTLNSVGNWMFSGTPSSYPVAIVYRVRQKFSTYVDEDSNILGNPLYDEVQSVNGKSGEVVLDALDVGALDAVNALTVELLWNQLYPSFYTELTYDINNRVTQQDIWDTPSKVTQIFTKTYTYSGNQVTQVDITHLIDGAVLTKNFTYNLNGFITNVNRAYTP